MKALESVGIPFEFKDLEMRMRVPQDEGIAADSILRENKELAQALSKKDASKQLWISDQATFLDYLRKQKPALSEALFPETLKKEQATALTWHANVMRPSCLRFVKLLMAPKRDHVLLEMAEDELFELVLPQLEDRLSKMAFAAGEQVTFVDI